MAITLYDLAGADPELRFSPYCWRTKLALHHKGLEYTTMPWRFTDTAKLAPSGQGKVPVIIDGAKWVSDSWAIALHLDEAYPGTPKLFADPAALAAARFINSWCDWSVLPASRELAVPHVFAAIADQDKAYFTASREKAFSLPMAEIGADRAAAHKKFHHGLKPAEVTLASQPFLHGAAPGYGDYALLGTILWPYTVVPVSEPALFADGGALGHWFGRMMGLNGGWAAKAPTVRNRAQGRT